jgi:hypothetical protein
MRLGLTRIATVAVVLLSTLQLSTQNPNNPIQLALLRWYPANTVAQLSPCAEPEGMAFDGSHVWVACLGTNELQEFNASDGALVRTVTGLGGPYALAYDGANIWATDYSSNQVTDINASTGAISGSFNVQSEPSGIAFDGTNMWITNYGSNSISQVVATTGAVTNYALSSCPTLYGVAFESFDGLNLWVSCHTSNVVAEVTTSTGGVLRTVTVGQGPLSVVYDGETGQTNGPFVWITNTDSGTVSKISLATFTTPSGFSAGSEPYGMVFDGLFIWVTNPGAGTVTKLYQSNGATAGTFTPGATPLFMGFDGGNVYVSNHGSGTISKM